MNKSSDLSRTVLTDFFNHAKNNKSLNKEEAYKLLDSVEKLEKKPQYQIETQRQLDTTTNKVDTIFKIHSLSENLDDHSKFNIHDILDYDKSLKFYYEGDDLLIEFNKIDLNGINKNLLKRQLYYKIYVEILSKGKNSGIKNIESIINKYIENIGHYNKMGSKNYKAVILGNDRYDNKSTKKIKFSKNFNKPFLDKISTYFEGVKEIDRINSTYEYDELYDNIINSYKRFVSKKIFDLKKYTNSFSNYDDLSKSQTKILSSILIKINEYEKKLATIDHILESEGISEFIKEINQINDEKKLIIEKQIEKNKGKHYNIRLKKVLDLIKEEHNLLKEFKNLYQKNIEELDLRSKDIKKGEVLFEIIVDNSSDLYDTNGEKIKTPFLNILLLFSITKDSEDFEYKIYQNGIKIISKKSGILIDRFKNGKLELEINTDLYTDYELIDNGTIELDYGEYYTNEKLINNYTSIDNIDNNIDFLGIEDTNIQNNLNQSFQKCIDNNNSIPKIYISKFSRIDNVEGIGIYGQYLSLGKIENYGEGKKCQTIYLGEESIEEGTIVKPPIYGEKINIKYQDNNDQTIVLVSDDYLNLSLMWEHSKLKDSLYKDKNEIEYIFEYNNVENPFLLNSNFIDSIYDKINFLQEHIEEYENKRRFLVGKYINIEKIILEQDILKKIYFNINDKLKTEIRKKDEKGNLVNNINHMKNYLDDLFIEIPKILLKKVNNIDDIKALKDYFIYLIDIFYLSESTKINIGLLTRYKYYLDNIDNQNTEQELRINFNSGRKCKIKIDGISTDRMNIRSNIKLEIVGENIYIPRGIGISIKVEKGIINIHIDKTLNDLINEEIEKLDKEYFCSLTDKQLQNKSKAFIKEINNYTEYKKSMLLEKIEEMILSSRDIPKLMKPDGIKSFIGLKFLSELKNETKIFESRLKKT